MAALVLLAGWWLWPRSPGEPRAPVERPPRAAGVHVPPDSTQALPKPGGQEEPGGAAQGEGLLWLQARLLPPSSGGAFQGRAWVGPAFISESDRNEWELVRRESGAEAAPERVEALANVRAWLPAQVVAQAAGGAQLGPVPVPSAPLYRLAAWGEEGTFYWGDFVPPGGSAPGQGLLEAGELEARRATGLRVRLVRAPPGAVRYLARLERVVDVDEASAERASALLPLVRLVAPELAGALQEEGVVPLVVGQETLLAPLLPDRALRLRLFSEGGREGEPLEVALREGQVEEVEVDLERAFPGGAESFVELRGRLLLGRGSRAPEGARLERLQAPGTEVRPGPEGHFVFPRVPAWQPSRFVAWVARPATGRPLAPERWEVEWAPGPGPHEESAEVVWRVPAYRWLVLRLDGFARGQLALRARRPYPVYMLQRQEAPGRWRTQPSEEFLQEEQGVAVSVLEPGTYRVLAAASPYEVYESAAVVLGEEEQERAVALSVLEDSVPCEVLVTERSTGAPLYGARVVAAGEHGSLPPMLGRTDGQGRWALGRVRGSRLYLEVEAQGHAPWSAEVSAACRQSGRVQATL